ncbi:hypothetical protein HY624_04115, partial [Candidatus Uhrbacteria bacterium]|nr:hypothetical protein [Candidatus Uhrbacteria bacterium]
MSVFFFSFLSAAGLTAVLVPCVRACALRFGVVDHPEVDRDRKIHERATPLTGGLAVSLSFFIVVGGVLFFGADLHSS